MTLSCNSCRAIATLFVLDISIPIFTLYVLQTLQTFWIVYNGTYYLICVFVVFLRPNVRNKLAISKLVKLQSSFLLKDSNYQTKLA